MTLKQKRLVFILAGVLIFLASLLLIFRSNMDKVSKLQKENIELQSEIDTLGDLQVKVNKMKQTTEQKQKEIETYAQEYPCRMTQQKVISNLYHLWVESGMELRSIKPGTESIFFKDGKLVETSGGEEVAAADEAQDTELSEAEQHPESKVPFHEMVGKVTSYDLEVTGTRKQIFKAFDWLSDNKEHMSLSKINLSFDSSTGKLTGTLTVNFYCLNGNGVPYVEPDISGITLGNDDVFGTFKKSKK